MIGYLNGTALCADVLLVGGVGYHVNTVSPMTPDTPVALWVHTAVRENDISLYGFETIPQRELFLALMKVSGVGPRMALGMLSLGTAALAGALLANDAKALAKAPGIGVMKAGKILASVNMPEQFLRDLAGDDVGIDPLADLTATLADMGHDPQAARRALDAASAATPAAPAPLLLRAALRTLNQSAGAGV